MIESDATQGGASGVSDCQPGTVTRPLPPSVLAGLRPPARVSLLLERLIRVAGAVSGIVLFEDQSGRLVEHARHDDIDREQPVLPAIVTDVPFGLTVLQSAAQAASNHEGGANGVSSDVSEADDNRAVLWLPLEIGGELRGGVRLGFAEPPSLEPAALEQLTVIADHIATTIEVDRLSRESARRQSEVERVSAQLTEVDRMKAEFLSMISHELRTPLTAIIGYTDLLLRQIHGLLNERQSRHQEAVKKAAHRLLALINDLLDVNRLESGQIVLNLERVSLSEAVRRATEQMEHAAEQRGVALRLDMPAAQITVSADHERLHQILVNLLDNAVKFTAAEGTVTVRVDHHGDAASVAVIDTGVGVPPEQLGRIWDRFYQADSSTRRHFGGTGLGLAIVRHLVEGHGGRVSVASNGAGQGSTFAFSLPVVDSTRRTEIAQEPPEPAAQPTVGRRCRVLIVDDEPDNREVIRSMVQDVLGHIAETAADGQEGLDRATANFDLILLDLRMPALSGFEVARRLKARPETAHIPILAITAFNEDVELAEARAAGCEGCITKPFTDEALAAAMSSVLAASGSGAGR